MVSKFLNLTLQKGTQNYFLLRKSQLQWHRNQDFSSLTTNTNKDSLPKRQERKPTNFLHHSPPVLTEQTAQAETQRHQQKVLQKYGAQMVNLKQLK